MMNINVESLNVGSFITPIPVSYTHLDVYKRQMEREMDKVELFILTGLLKVGFGKTIKESIRVIVRKQLQVINNDIREIIT